MGLYRQKKLSSLYLELISKWLFLHQEVKGAIMSVTNVAISDDLKHIKACVSVWPDEKEKDVLEFLKKSSRELRADLAQSVKAKFAPDIEFVLDESEKKRLRIEKLLKKAK